MRSKNEFLIFLLAISFYFFSMDTIPVLIIFTIMVLKNIVSFSRLKKNIQAALVFTYTRFTHLWLPDKIILLASIMAASSLWWEWIIFETLSYNSFHPLTGSNGYLLCFLIWILLFFTLSLHHKHKIKLHSGLSFNDYHLAIVVGILLIVLPINSLMFIHGLSSLSESQHGSGIGVSIASGLAIFVWALLKKKYHHNEDISLHMVSSQGNSQQDTRDTNTQDNMKLPF
jgi:hypothetical protein